jgi:hypothetical protein
MRLTQPRPAPRAPGPGRGRGATSRDRRAPTGRLSAARLGQVRAGLGMAQLLFPGLAARLVAKQHLDRRSRVAVRVLGARQLTQALATGAQPTVAVLALGAGVDSAHALSMLALGLFDRRGRRAALIDTLIGAGFAVAGAAAARADGRPAAQANPPARRNRGADRLPLRLGSVVRRGMPIPVG